jgi:AcrR family transcriptional regulator
MAETKQKILDTAEKLVAAQGFAATSLRQIIAQAGVNLAAVHYHFGSKQELLHKLLERKLAGVNRQRLQLLESLQAAYGARTVPVEKLLAAFFEPMIETGGQNPQFVKVMGRLYGEGLMPTVFEKHFQPTTARFVKALESSLPHLPEAELYWRLQFMFGATAQAAFGWDVSFNGARARRGQDDFKRVMRKLMTFLSAGFRAPATPEVTK